jgi:archaellum component FlaC
MAIFGLNSQEGQNLLDQAAQQPYEPTLPAESPGTFEGSIEATFGGLRTASAGSLLLLGDVQRQLSGQEPTEQERAERQEMVDFIRSLRPKPETTGLLGNVLYGLSSGVATFAAGSVLGGPIGGTAAVATVMGNTEASVLKAEGVDAATAETVGTIQGLAQGVGFAVPGAIPGSLATRVASGVGINVGIGGVERGATSSVLEDAGYKDMAEQYRVLDGMAILVDAGLGAFAGAVHGGARSEPRPDPLPSEVDAALAANNIRHYELDSAPGIPADTATRNAHAAAMDRAIEQVIRGEPVDVAETVKSVNFLSRAEDEQAREAASYFASEIGELAESTAINPALRARQEAGIGDALLTRPEQADTIAAAENPELIAEQARVSQQYEIIKARADDLESRVGEPTSAEGDAAGQLQDILNDLKQTDDPRRIKRLERQREELLSAFSPEQRQRIEMKTELDNLRPQVDELESTLKEMSAAVKQAKTLAERAITRSALTIEAAPSAMEARGITPSQAVSAPTAVRPERAAGSPTETTMAEEAGRSAQTQEESSALAIAAEKPDLQIVDEDGNATTAAEALAKADREIAQAQKDQGVFDAAVSCFLRFGGEG